jgi:hypothetical protein
MNSLDVLTNAGQKWSQSGINQYTEKDLHWVRGEREREREREKVRERDREREREREEQQVVRDRKIDRNKCIYM